MNSGKIFLYILKLAYIFMFSLFLLMVFLLGEGLKNDTFPNNTPLYLVVYGNTVNEDGTLSNRLKARLDATLEILKNYEVKKIIVSGAIGKEGYDEAQKMSEYLQINGILEKNILIDSKGYTTNDTSINAYKLISEKEKDITSVSIIGVSQYFHIARVKLSLKQAGFQNIYGFAPKYFEIRDIYSLFREILGYIKYLF